MLEVKIDNLSGVLKLADKYPAIAEKHVNTAIAGSLVRVLAAEKMEAPFGVTGRLRDDWTIQNGRFTGTLRSNAPYAMAVHDGTRPHFVSGESLGPWAKKKGLNPYAVAKSIAKKGTKANPFFKRAIEGTEAQINKLFDSALEAIGFDLSRL